MLSPCQRKRFLLLAVLLIIVGGVWLWGSARRNASRTGEIPGGGGASVQELAARLGALETKERDADQSIWAKERLAQRCGLIVEQLWDLLNVATNKLDVFRAVPFDELTVAEYRERESIGHAIEVLMPGPSHTLWTPAMWQRYLDERQRDGWRLAQAEFRHNRFEVDSAGQPKRSTFYFSAHLASAIRDQRASLEGDLTVDWTPGKTGEELPGIRRLDATRLSLRIRPGEAAFRPALFEEITPPKGSFFIDPLILYDLDGDGRSEIILAAKNLVFRNEPGDRFVSESLCRYSPGLLFTGVIADFDGDGAADFLCAKFEGLMLFRGSSKGRFEEPGQLVWGASPHLKYGQALACGDIDKDGDLDVWLGQYKVPYERGQMPTPYSDANDGHPSYLLSNDGQGNLADITAASGLAQKRWRRTYSGSLADLDSDGDLDLMVMSDFAGIDLYANDGSGRFRDVTHEWIQESRGFGMSHAAADFNADGRLDFLMIGMNSPTVDRLESLGLTRTTAANERAARRAMVFGNRLCLARQGLPLFEQTSLNDSIARSGWSWGCSAFDFDNDGFPDVYIANGHESKQSVREYEPEFWLHDIFVADSKEQVVATAYFGSQFTKTRGRGFSYGGHESNRLFLNRRAESFLEIGHLMGVSLGADSRNVVADDLDGDGRMDLLVTTFEAWPKTRQTLRVFKNTLADGGNWIGFRLREQGRRASPVGARITLHHRSGTVMRSILTGDSYRSQHANTAHFGLGSRAEVERAEIRWVNGQSLVLQRPAINQYHEVRLP
ncbi:MAG: CRTAC1 family protein [Verrucomicrobia bacterium]|nr:CRTAC1 family protein [Verrucomicrobiota bacterium]